MAAPVGGIVFSQGVVGHKGKRLQNLGLLYVSGKSTIWDEGVKAKGSIGAPGAKMKRRGERPRALFCWCCPVRCQVARLVEGFIVPRGLHAGWCYTIPNTIAARKPNDVIAANAFRLIFNSIVASFAGNRRLGSTAGTVPNCDI